MKGSFIVKVYISVDIEGITGVTSWNETILGDLEHKAAAEQMTRETLAAISGAIEAGAEEIYVKDAHDSGRNLDISNFPKEVKIIRDWAGEPCGMITGLDKSFDAVIFIGYHSASYENTNPLAHTLNNGKISYIKVNDEIASEFLLYSYRAWEIGVPSVFISGDLNICNKAKDMVEGIETVPVKEGNGGATINISPLLALENIKKGVKKSLLNIESCKMVIPDTYKMEISFKDHTDSNKGTFYPGVRRVDGKTLEFEANSVIEMMTTRMFIM